MNEIETQSASNGLFGNNRPCVGFLTAILLCVAGIVLRCSAYHRASFSVVQQRAAFHIGEWLFAVGAALLILSFAVWMIDGMLMCRRDIRKNT